LGERDAVKKGCLRAGKKRRGVGDGMGEKESGPEGFEK